MNHPKVEKALKEVLEMLESISDEEFRDALEKHKNGEWAEALKYAWENHDRLEKDENSS